VKSFDFIFGGNESRNFCVCECGVVWVREEYSRAKRKVFLVTFQPFLCVRREKNFLDFF
jgi:hypothetical protein